MLGIIHKAKECFSIRDFATVAMKLAPMWLPCNNKGKDKKQDNDKDDQDDFYDVLTEVSYIFGDPNAYESKRKQKHALREVNILAPATQEYLRWSLNHL